MYMCACLRLSDHAEVLACLTFSSFTRIACHRKPTLIYYTPTREMLDNTRQTRIICSWEKIV